MPTFLLLLAFTGLYQSSFSRLGTGEYKLGMYGFSLETSNSPNFRNLERTQVERAIFCMHLLKKLHVKLASKLNSIAEKNRGPHGATNSGESAWQEVFGTNMHKLDSNCLSLSAPRRLCPMNMNSVQIRLCSLAPWPPSPNAWGKVGPEADFSQHARAN